MTCIVGLAGENGDIWLGADTLITMGTTRMGPTEKLMRLSDDVIVGASGHCRSNDVFATFRPPERVDGEDALRYMIGPFASALRTHYENADFLTRPEERSPAKLAGDMRAIIACAGQLFDIGNDLAIIRQNYNAAGSGMHYALGSLSSTRGIPDDRERVLTALRASADCCISVAAPFDIWCINGKKLAKERVKE